jgi:hypothetical protein
VFMHATRALLICVLLFACGCTRAQGPQDAQAAPPKNAASQPQASNRETASPQTRAAADTTQALGEFAPLTRADVDLYLNVMRTAAERIKNMSAADRAVLKAYRKLTANPDPNQIPSAEQIMAIQRAGELMTLDSAVARELGITRRYNSISGRVAAFIMPMGGEGDDDATPMTAERKAQLKLRIERFRERRRLDAATLEPHREEIQSLQKQVNLILHPESIPA